MTGPDPGFWRGMGYALGLLAVFLFIIWLVTG